MSFNKFTDCEFFFKKKCSKGNRCSFRHANQVLECKYDCLAWAEGNCFNVNCPYLHFRCPKGNFKPLVTSSTYSGALETKKSVIMTICKYHLHGKCTRGKACLYLHDDSISGSGSSSDLALSTTDVLTMCGDDGDDRDSNSIDGVKTTIPTTNVVEQAVDKGMDMGVNDINSDGLDRNAQQLKKPKLTSGSAVLAKYSMKSYVHGKVTKEGTESEWDRVVTNSTPSNSDGQLDVTKSSTS